jgi:transcriptional regulator with XRE-family HTH domain
MNIGTNIKRLRRERDITQEQLAEYLNISISAISQWECEKTAPDISLLAPLANIFDVSADVLLGIDVINKEKQIHDIAVNVK